MWVIVLCTGSAFSGIRDFLYAISSEKIGVSIRERFFETIVKKDTSFFDDRKVGDILSRLTSDTQIVQNGLTTNVAMFLKSLFVIVAIFIILAIYNWRNTLISIAFLAPMFFVMPIWSRLTQFTQKQYQEVKAEQSSVANETLGNIKTVKAFSGENIGCYFFNESNEGVYNIGKNMAKYYATMMFFFQWFFNGAFVGIAFFSSKSVKNGELSPGEVAAYLLYNWQIIWNIMGLNSNLQQVAKVQGAFYEIASLITQPIKQKGYYDTKEVTKAQTESEIGEIDVTDIGFNYPSKPDVKVLNKVNINIANCSTVALVGHSGCGKSSIIALIERFYDPIEGKVFFNKQDIQEIDTKWYHQSKLAIV